MPLPLLEASYLSVQTGPEDVSVPHLLSLRLPRPEAWLNSFDISSLKVILQQRTQGGVAPNASDPGPLMSSHSPFSVTQTLLKGWL